MIAHQLRISGLQIRPRRAQLFEPDSPIGRNPGVSRGREAGCAPVKQVRRRDAVHIENQAHYRHSDRGLHQQHEQAHQNEIQNRAPNVE